MSRRSQIWIVLSVFTLLATIYLKVWAKALLKNARSPLPVDVQGDARQPEVELKKKKRLFLSSLTLSVLRLTPRFVASLSWPSRSLGSLDTLHTNKSDL